MILAKNPCSLLLAIGIIASWFLQASLAQELDLNNVTASYDLEAIFVEAGAGIIDFNRLGALKFIEFDDGRNEEYLCTVANATRSNSAIYCLDVIRDAADGKLTGLTYDGKGPIEIETTDGETVLEYPQLAHSFAPGPGGYDYMALEYWQKIALVEWSRATSGRPKLNMVHDMKHTLSEVLIIESVAFSNIVQDPETGFGMMFGAALGFMVEIPLVPHRDVFEIDTENIRFLCSDEHLPMGSMNTIATGANSNDFIVTDFDRKSIVVLDVDDGSGYPMGVTDSTRVPLLGRIDLPNVECQVQDFMSTDPFNPWGAVFDKKTGGYLFSNFDSSQDKSAILYQLGVEGGFGPGFDTSVVKANLVSVFSDLVSLSEGDKDQDGKHRRYLSYSSKSKKAEEELITDVHCEFSRKDGDLVQCTSVIRGIRSLFKSTEWANSVTAGEASPSVIALCDSLALSLKDAKKSFSKPLKYRAILQHVRKLTKFGLCLLDIVRNIGDPENTPSCSAP